MAEANDAVRIQREVHDLRRRQDRINHLLNRIEEFLAEEQDPTTKEQS